MVVVLAFLQTPHVEIAPRSWAHDLLVPSNLVGEPLGLAAWGGFGDLRKHLLPKGDEEVRVWDGFGVTNLSGVILRKRAGVWTATRLTGGIPGTKFRSWKVGYATPKSGWPVFWRRAETLGLWNLPDMSELPQKDRQWIADGFSYLVELQREGRYRAYAYDNPDLQTRWPKAAKMAALGKLIYAEFPVPARRR